MSIAVDCNAAAFQIGLLFSGSLDIAEVYNGNQKVKLLVNRKMIFDENIDLPKTVAAKFIMPESGFVTTSIVLDDVDSTLVPENSLDNHRLGIKISEIKIEQ